MRNLTFCFTIFLTFFVLASGCEQPKADTPQRKTADPSQNAPAHSDSIQKADPAKNDETPKTTPPVIEEQPLPTKPETADDSVTTEETDAVAILKKLGGVVTLDKEGHATKVDMTLAEYESDDLKQHLAVFVRVVVLRHNLRSRAVAVARVLEQIGRLEAHTC